MTALSHDIRIHRCGPGVALACDTCGVTIAYSEAEATRFDIMLEHVAAHMDIPIP